MRKKIMWVTLLAAAIVVITAHIPSPVQRHRRLDSSAPRSPRPIRRNQRVQSLVLPDVGGSAAQEKESGSRGRNPGIVGRVCARQRLGTRGSTGGTASGHSLITVTAGT